MSASGALRRRRRALWAESPLCRRCGIETVLPETLLAKYGSDKRYPPAERARMATIEHKNDRNHGPRPQTKWGERTLTLWCWACNNGDAARKTAKLSVEERRLMSGRCAHGRDLKREFCVMCAAVAGAAAP